MNPDLQKCLMDISLFYQLKKCEVLLVAEAGSRQWGYANADSDHDLVIVYRQLDPTRLLFGEPKHTPNLPEGFSAFVYEWSDFIKLALKPNINLLMYLSPVYYAVAHSDGERTLEIYNGHGQVYYAEKSYLYPLASALYARMLTDSVFLARLRQQAFGCVHSYYKTGETKKDFIRLAYLASLACQLNSFPILVLNGYKTTYPVHWLVSPDRSPCGLTDALKGEFNMWYLNAVSNIVDEAIELANATESAEKRALPMSAHERAMFDELYAVVKAHTPDFTALPKRTKDFSVLDKVKLYNGAWSVESENLRVIKKGD